MKPILADVVWPALYVSEHQLSLPIIGASLVIEYFFVSWLLKVEFKKSALYTLTMNAVSALLGIVLVPLFGLAYALVADLTTSSGTFSPWKLPGLVLVLAALNTGIELGSLRLIFKISWCKRNFWWLCVANLITVSMAVVAWQIAEATGTQKTY